MENDLSTMPITEMQALGNQISKGLEAFEAKKEELIALNNEVEGLDIKSLDDKAGLKVVADGRKKLKNARIEIEKEGKSMRDPLTAKSRLISAKEDELIQIIAPTEKKLKGIEDWVKKEEARVEQEEKEKEEKRIQDRIDKLAGYGFEIDLNMIKGLTDEGFEKVIANAKAEFEKEEANRKEQERIKEEERKELEELRRQKAESERIIKDQQEKIESDRLEKERREKAESDRLIREAERERLEEEAEKDRREEERIRDEKAKEKVMKDIRFEGRKKQLLDMGFTPSGIVGYSDFSLKDTWSCYWEQVYNPSDEDWASYVVAIEEAIEHRKIRMADEENKRAAAIEQARLDGIAEAEKKARQKEELEAEQMAQASDKEKFMLIVKQMEALTYPEFKSVKHKKLLGEVKELQNKIIAHIRAKV